MAEVAITDADNNGIQHQEEEQEKLLLWQGWQEGNAEHMKKLISVLNFPLACFATCEDGHKRRQDKLSRPAVATFLPATFLVGAGRGR